MKTLEEITYEAGRHSLAEQESVVAGIRQRTGTLLAAHAAVASFLGGTAIRAGGIGPVGYVALGLLLLGLACAAVLLAPWSLSFTVDAHALYDEFHGPAAAEADAGTQAWLAGAGFSYDALREQNRPVVRRLSWASGLLAAFLVASTICWLLVLGVHL
ncbi:MAG TPA: hypothetical protein VNB64_14115 [Solirubrobacteraceae bacterium]|nr:hypothetical protein [Solirubrobacteraceae bacterium]